MPACAASSAGVSVTGTGFPPKATIDLVLKRQAGGQNLSLRRLQVVVDAVQREHPCGAVEDAVRRTRIAVARLTDGAAVDEKSRAAIRRDLDL